MRLYGYSRSSAAFRVRIALNLKGLSYENASIYLRHGDQRQPPFLAVNPQGLVPQVVNAERYGLVMSPYPTITRIFERCMTLDAFAAAHPQRQPDYQE